jgi:DegV family protein with EDD domain
MRTVGSVSVSAAVVVTDSTAYLPEGFADRQSVSVVPLHVLVDQDSSLDGVDFGPAELAKALDERRTVTTSRPTPAEFAASYQAALRAGAPGVVSVHLSRDLSGTWEAARLAAEEINDKTGATVVRVVDSRTTGMGLGFAVLAAAKAAAAGAEPSEVERVAVDVASRTRTMFCLQTLEHLRRGGRIGPTAALVGSALAVKPLLHVSGGRLLPLEKVRTGRYRRAPPRHPGTRRRTGHPPGRTPAERGRLPGVGGRRGDRRAHRHGRPGRRRPTRRPVSVGVRRSPPRRARPRTGRMP